MRSSILVMYKSWRCHKCASFEGAPSSDGLEQRLYITMDDMTAPKKGIQKIWITPWWLAAVLAINPASSMSVDGTWAKLTKQTDIWIQKIVSVNLASSYLPFEHVCWPDLDTTAPHHNHYNHWHCFVQLEEVEMRSPSLFKVYSQESVAYTTLNKDGGSISTSYCCTKMNLKYFGLDAGFMTCTTRCHKRAIKMMWLHLGGCRVIHLYWQSLWRHCKARRILIF